MAFEGPMICDGSRAAGGDLSSSQYKFVKLNSSGQVVSIAANTDIPYGILQNAPASGGQATVALCGVSKVQGDADLAKGNVIGTSADGQAAAYANGTDTTKYIVGHVLEDNSAAGGLATVAFSCLTPNRGA
jgi:hypothetical protein